MKECLWYDGTEGVYELLDFDPNGLSNEQVKEKALKCLKDKYGFAEWEMEKVSETLYLIDINNLENL